MTAKGSPIRGLEPTINEFTLETYALNTENERLTQLLLSKNNQIKTLIENNTRLKNTYEAQASAYKKTIESLEKQLNQNESSREEEYQIIKQKYERFNKEELSTLKDSHSNEIEFLFKEIAQLRTNIEAQVAKLDLKDHQLNTLRESYERELTLNANEINTLNKKLIQSEEDKSKEIKELTNKRDLEKSRTSGIVHSRKESNQYIEKQLRKLNEDILQKTIQIENASRELNKQKKKHQESVKNLNKKIEQLTQDYEGQLKQKEEHFNKIEGILKAQILEHKAKQINLMSENETLKSNQNILKKEIENKDTVIKAKTDDIFNLKNTIDKIREEHINQINNLLKERKKRSSKSNLGSSRSLSSSIKEGNTPNPASSPEQDFANKLANFLPIVKEQATPSPERKDLSRELSHSNILQQQPEDDELARAVFHFENIIEELKKSHEMEVEYYKIELDKESVKLKQKQLQLQDVLTRFSPLVQIHTQQKSLEKDRKERIQRHWKADVGILEIMLKKHKIATF